MGKVQKPSDSITPYHECYYGLYVQGSLVYSQHDPEVYSGNTLRETSQLLAQILETWNVSDCRKCFGTINRCNSRSETCTDTCTGSIKSCDTWSFDTLRITSRIFRPFTALCRYTPLVCMQTVSSHPLQFHQNNFSVMRDGGLIKHRMKIGPFVE
jgi:hypothetical protein